METEKRQTSEPEGKSGLILVSGFLGAGKTTLLKHILSWKRDMSDTVVIVNEFGDIGIDGSLLAGQASDIVELTSGCICCTMVLDLTSTLQGIWRRSNPQWILVEASGIADPKAVVSAMQSDELRRRIGFLKTVTVLDAEIWEMREVMGRIFYNQLETADMVLLNKVDRLDKETVKKCLEETGEFLPHTQIVPTTHCRIDADSLLLTSPPKDWTAGETEHPEDTVYDFTTFSFSYNAFLDEKSFERFMRNLPKNIFRVKGIVRFPGRTRFLNYVGGQTHWTPWDGKPETRLVFIGWDADQTPVLENLKKCLATGLGA